MADASSSSEDEAQALASVPVAGREEGREMSATDILRAIPDWLLWSWLAYVYALIAWDIVDALKARRARGRG